MFNSLSEIWLERRMQSARRARAFLLVMAVCSAAIGNATASDAKATEAATPSAEVTFQFLNDTGRALNLKLFSRGESLAQWPAKTKAYSLRPAEAVQQLKIKCVEGENVCWGAWMTVQSVSGEMVGTTGRVTYTTTMNAGVGQKGIRECTDCCHVCKAGLVTPVARLSTSSAVGPQVR
ncbi:MAG: hypothetical protein ACK5UX_02840 [Burkholderiales bacterium]|jgi:hypothetical protein|nr:hypothetical protein [Nitrosomonadaceae bacterium]